MWYLQAVEGRADHPWGLGLASQLKWKEILVSFNEVCLWRCSSAKPRKKAGGPERGNKITKSLLSLHLTLTSHPICNHLIKSACKLSVGLNNEKLTYALGQNTKVPHADSEVSDQQAGLNLDTSHVRVLFLKRD